jgi:hypothetical protein
MKEFSLRGVKPSCIAHWGGGGAADDQKNKKKQNNINQ